MPWVCNSPGADSDRRRSRRGPTRTHSYRRRNTGPPQQPPTLAAITEPGGSAAALAQPRHELLLLHTQPIRGASTADEVEAADGTLVLQKGLGPRPGSNDIDRLAEALLELSQEYREQHDVAEGATAHDQGAHLRGTRRRWSKLGTVRHQRFPRASRATPYSRLSSCSISDCKLSTPAAAVVRGT
jgi:hypothetical protein